MTNQEIKETLEKQLQLLSERSSALSLGEELELAVLSSEMVSISELLKSFKSNVISNCAWRVTWAIMLLGAALNLIALLVRFWP